MWLKGTAYESNGKSPRCPINQVRNKGWGEWIHDCSGIRSNKTVKGVLQAWTEGHARSTDSTWWGLEQAEMEQWVIPCLSQSNNYWVKYQYIATVYSKDRDIWPGIWSRPMPFVSPRIWSITCDKASTTCTVSLARQHCQGVPGWEDHCQLYYKEEYDTYGSVEENTEQMVESISPKNWMCQRHFGAWNVKKKSTRKDCTVRSKPNDHRRRRTCLQEKPVRRERIHGV